MIDSFRADQPGDGHALCAKPVHDAAGQHARDRFIGVVRMGHALSQGAITPARYASGRHISVSRRGRATGPIDDALQPFGLERAIVTIVGDFATALALARASDLIASVPERQTGNLRGDSLKGYVSRSQRASALTAC